MSVLFLQERNELYGSILNIAKIEKKPAPRRYRLYWVNTHSSPPSDATRHGNGSIYSDGQTNSDACLRIVPETKSVN